MIVVHVEVQLLAVASWVMYDVNNAMFIDCLVLLKNHKLA